MLPGDLLVPEPQPRVAVGVHDVLAQPLHQRPQPDVGDDHAEHADEQRQVMPERDRLQHRAQSDQDGSGGHLVRGSTQPEAVPRDDRGRGTRQPQRATARAGAAQRALRVAQVAHDQGGGGGRGEAAGVLAQLEDPDPAQGAQVEGGPAGEQHERHGRQHGWQ